MRRTIVLLWVLLTWQTAGFGQNYIEEFSARQDKNGIHLSIQTSGVCQHEILPFDSKHYTLVKFKPLVFANGVKDKAEAQLKKLNVKIHALELSDPAVLFAFKGILSKGIALRQSGSTLQIDISAPTRSAHSDPGSNLKKARHYYESAVTFYEQKKYGRALSALHKALRIRPQYPEAYFLAGKIRFEKQEWQKARINFSRAIHMDPNVGDAKRYLEAIQDKMKERETSEDLALPKHELAAENNKDSGADSAQHYAHVENENADRNSTQLAIAERDSSNNAKTEREIQKPPAQDLSFHAKSKFHFALQTGMFFLILSISFGWPILLWLKRKELGSNPQPKAAQTMVQTGLLDGSAFAREMEQRLQKLSPNRLAREDFSKNPEEESFDSGRKPQAHRHEPFSKIRRLFFPEKTMDKRETEMLRLAGLGYSVEEIAERLGMGKVEVQLFLNLQGKKVPMSSPALRIEMME